MATYTRTIDEDLDISEVTVGAMTFSVIRPPQFGDKTTEEVDDGTITFEWSNVQYDFKYEGSTDPVYVAVNKNNISEEVTWGADTESLKPSDEDCGEWEPDEINSELFGVEIGYEVPSGALTAAGYGSADIGEVLNQVKIQDVTLEVFYEEELSYGDLGTFGESFLAVEREGPFPVAVGAQGSIYKETDPVNNTWEDISPGNSLFSEDIHSVKYVPFLGKFVLGGKNGFLATIDSSETVTRLNSPTRQHILSVATELNKVVLSGSNELSLYSTDLNSWSHSHIWVNPYTPVIPCYSTSIDITGATLSGSYAFSSDFISIDTDSGAVFSADGTKLFLINDEASTKIYRFDLSTPFDLSTMSLNSGQTITVSENFPSGVEISALGDKIFYCGREQDETKMETLGTNFDLTTTTTPTATLPAQSSNIFGIVFNNDGSKLYEISNGIHQYNLSEAYDISTATLTNTVDLVDIGSPETSPFFIRLTNSGTQMFLGRSTGLLGEIHQFALSTAFDISTASFTQTMTLSGTEVITAFMFNTDETKFFVLDTAFDGSNTLREYTF